MLLFGAIPLVSPNHIVTFWPLPQHLVIRKRLGQEAGSKGCNGSEISWINNGFQSANTLFNAEVNSIFQLFIVMKTNVFANWCIGLN